MLGLNALSESPIMSDGFYSLYPQSPSVLPTPDYTNLITSEHIDKPKFMAMIQVITQPYIDNILLLRNMASLFDVDTAVGNQLDIIGEWVGISRNLTVPLTNVYFSFDTPGLGFDEGTWQGPFDPGTGLVSLPDDPYRNLIKATIAENSWDGTTESAVSIWNSVFASEGITIAIEDYGDMTISLGIISSSPIDAVTKALLKSNQIRLKPEAVAIRNYVSPSVPNTPFFGFDIQNSTISGFDIGSWALPL